MAAIEVEGLWKIFGDDPEEARRLAQEENLSKAEVKAETGSVIAVNDATFEVEEQEIFVVMGLSGSGKSTLLRCVNRLIEPTFGTVHVRGENVTAFDDDELRKIRRTRMSMVFQNFGLFPHRSVLGNVEYGLEVSGMDKQQRREKARNTLDLVGLKGYEDSNPSELSGGMQQRVGLARALALDPKIVLFDEPTSGLDPVMSAAINDLILRTKEEFRATCVVISHDIQATMKTADNIFMLYEGRIIAEGDPETISEWEDPVVRQFIHGQAQGPIKVN